MISCLRAVKDLDRQDRLLSPPRNEQDVAAVEVAAMISSKSVRELIEELDCVDESEHLEAKAITGNDVGKSVYETICAMSNEPDLGGGTVLLGLEREEALFPLFHARGIKNPDKAVCDIASGCATIFNVPIRPTISQERVNNATVIRVDVAEAQKSQKPVYIKSRGLPRGAFRRIGSSDQCCTEDDLRVLISGTAIEPYDYHVIGDCCYDDLDEESIDVYRRTRAIHNPLAEELKWDDREIVHALGGLKSIDNHFEVTMTGILCFGKTSALRRLFPSQRIDYIRVPGKEWIKNPDNHFESVDMRGPITKIIPRALAYVLEDIPKTFRFDDNSGQRHDVPIVPSRVIREAIVNSVMHRNYQSLRPIQIIRYSNRIVFCNPGYSLKSEERFDEPGSSLRNPHIAEILHEIGFSETKGSGIRVMKEKMNEMNLAPPTFISDRNSDEFSATFLFHHFWAEEDWEWLARFGKFDLVEDQMRALVFARETGAIDNAAYRSLTQADTLSASRGLRKLKEMGLLELRGSGSRTHYVPGTEMHAADAAIDRGIRDKGLSTHDRDASIHGMSNDGAETRSEKDPPDMPEHLRNMLDRIGKRSDPFFIEKVIRELCQWKALSAEEIAHYLRKTPPYVSNKFLYGMVHKGDLSYLYPTMPKHPDQKYLRPVR